MYILKCKVQRSAAQFRITLFWYQWSDTILVYCQNNRKISLTLYLAIELTAAWQRMFFLFVVNVCKLRKLSITNEYRASGNKMDGEHPGKHLRARRNIHTLQTIRTPNTNHSKNTNNTHTINTGQTTYTQIPKLRLRSSKNSCAHTTEGIVRLRFWA